MYRSFLIFPRKGSYKILPSLRHSGTTSEGSRRVALPLSIIASTGLGFAGAIVYGKYDPNFRSTLESIPYVKNIYDFFPKEKTEEKSLPVKDRSSNESKMKDTPSLLKKKPDSKKVTAEPKGDSSVTSIQSKDDKNVANSNLVYTEIKKVEPFSESTVKTEDFASNLSETLDKLKKSAEGAMNAQKNAVNAVKNHTIKLYEALDLSEGKDGDLVWKDVKDATAFKEEALKTAKEKAAETKILIEKLKRDVKSLHEIEPSSPLVKNGEKSVSSYSSDLKKAESEVAAAESEAKSASEYEHLVNSLKDQFKKELNIVLPNYVHGDKGKDITEGDLNLLIAHAHRRIEQLQKQIAKLQVTEKLRVDQAIQNQKVQDEQNTESRIQAELKKRHLDLESAVENRVSSLKAKFEADLHQQLLRQAAAHTDHLKEVLKIQEEELDRKHILELEEKLLHQKGVFISEISGNMSRIKGILDFLKAKSEFDASSKASQALWLSCQALSDKINFDITRNLSLPLARDVASIKIAAGEDDDFTSSVLSSIPSDVVERGVYTSAALKERFEKVKTVCKKVALVDENNDSLFRYILSYLQSLFIIENICIPKEELEGKVAVNPAEWDTFDILNRISYNLKNNDIEQALRYANQLKGEPKAVAKDWITEMKFLLETQLAAKALLAHASAVGVQAYH